MPWKAEVLNDMVAAEIQDFSIDLRAKLDRIVHMLEVLGPFMVREPYIKHLTGKLWEMRVKGVDGIARAVYIAATGRRLEILHAFVKKSQKTPKGALETALKRAKEANLL